MKATYAGLFTGLILGIVAITQGFLAFLGVAFLGTIGLVIGMALDGRLDLRAFSAGERRRL